MSLTRFTTGSTSRRISASALTHGSAAEGSSAVGVSQSWRWLRYERGETAEAEPAGGRAPAEELRGGPGEGGRQGHGCFGVAAAGENETTQQTVLLGFN